VAWLQAFFYFNNYQNDSFYLRYAVLLVIFFDTTHQILISHTAYSYLVTNFNNPIFLTTCVWFCLVASFLYIVDLFSHSFLASRVWRCMLSLHICIPHFMILVVAEFGMVPHFCIRLPGSNLCLVKINTFEELKELRGLSISVNALAAIGDVLIACSLIVLLQKSKTGFKRSDTMINKLILFTVHTGSITTLFAISSLISITVAPNTFVYIFFFFCIGRLYTNSFLATLNARHAIRNIGKTADTTSNISLTRLFGKKTIGTAQVGFPCLIIEDLSHVL
ncbi:hypothetical protein K435DRAFT_702890, partial [Dendrothele bispora CBS 962.96]